MGAQPSSAQTTATIAGAIDVSDRAARLLGHVASPADVTTSATFSGAAQTLTLAVPSGSSQMGAFVSSGTGTIVAEYSGDGGVTWAPLIGGRVDLANTPSNTVLAGAGPSGFQAALPPGTTNVRVRCSAFTSNMPVALAVGQQQYESTVGVAGGTIDVTDRVARLLGVADVSDRSARLLGQVSAAAAATWDVSDRAARALGHVVDDGGIADTVRAAATVAGPGALGVIAQTAALAAGVYRLRVLCAYGAASSATDPANFELLHGATSLGRALAGAAGVFAETIVDRVTCAAADTITVRAVGAAASSYTASIDATRLA